MWNIHTLKDEKTLTAINFIKVILIVEPWLLKVVPVTVLNIQEKAKHRKTRLKHPYFPSYLISLFLEHPWSKKPKYWLPFD